MQNSLVWCLAMATAVLVGGCGVAGATQPMAGPNREQPAAPLEQTPAEQPLAAQSRALPLTIACDGLQLDLDPATNALTVTQRRRAKSW